MARRAVAGCALALLATGCELTETTAVDPVVVPVLEMVLRSGEPQQSAWLHRTGTADDAVPGARLRVRSASVADGPVLAFVAAERPFCVVFWRESFEHAGGSCYISTPGREELEIIPGGSYELEATLPDGARLTGGTTVPGAFHIRRPRISADTCALRPHTPFEVVWSRSSGAWAYVVEVNLYGLRDALSGEGIEIVDDPFFLRGISVSESDTTLVVPGGLGLFDITELDRDLLLALQRGLPSGVVAEVSVAAVDRNFVNWARGGGFNPSGQVRVSSVRGGGAGLFGSAVERRRVLRVGEGLVLPTC